MIRSPKHFFHIALMLALLLVFNSGYAQSGRAAAGKTDTLRLFLIGNSFSQNAARFLPQLAEEGGHPLVIGRAEIGGCTLQKHWYESYSGRRCILPGQFRPQTRVPERPQIRLRQSSLPCPACPDKLPASGILMG